MLSSQPLAAALDMLVTELPTLRFAVAALDGWPDVEEVSRDLGTRSQPLQDISYLGLHKVLAAADRPGAPALQKLRFPGNSQLISCTRGPLAQRLAGRLEGGAKTLQAALAHWLIGRHAAHLAHQIDREKITVWVRLHDVDEEQRAYRSLLARSSNSVGVHDLVGP